MAEYVNREKLLKRLEHSPHFENPQGHAWIKFLKLGVLDLIEKQPAVEVPEWVYVDERLPEKGGKYLVCNTRGSVYQTHYYIQPDAHWGQKDKGENIIAWMPMPVPPKIECWRMGCWR